jgi:methylthioribose-1-phosphate isomerase
LGRGFHSPVAPAGVASYNPAFDVTPADLVTAFITDRGVFRAPFQFAADGHVRAAVG